MRVTSTDAQELPPGHDRVPRRHLPRRDGPRPAPVRPAGGRAALRERRPGGAGVRDVPRLGVRRPRERPDRYPEGVRRRRLGRGHAVPDDREPPGAHRHDRRRPGLVRLDQRPQRRRADARAPRARGRRGGRGPRLARGLALAPAGARRSCPRASRTWPGGSGCRGRWTGRSTCSRSTRRCWRATPASTTRRATRSRSARTSTTSRSCTRPRTRGSTAACSPNAGSTRAWPRSTRRGSSPPRRAARSTRRRCQARPRRRPSRSANWSPPAPIRDPQSDAREQYGYDASWTVIREIVDEAGEDGMRTRVPRGRGRDDGVPGRGHAGARGPAQRLAPLPGPGRGARRRRRGGQPVRDVGAAR